MTNPTPERSVEEKKKYLNLVDDGFCHHGTETENYRRTKKLISTIIDDYTQTLQTERQRCEEVVEELRRDKERLDFLDRCNLTLNNHYQTNYGWKLIFNHNVTRLMSERGLDFIDLHDAEGGNKKFKSCRDAIDEALTQPNNK